MEGSYCNSPSGPEMKRWRTDARMEWATDLRIFNNSDSLWGLRQRGHKFIIPDFHSEHQPRKQQWAQDQNCHLPAEASVNRGTRLRSEASSPPRPWCHKTTSPPHPHAPDNIPGSVWEKTDQTGGELTKSYAKWDWVTTTGMQWKLKKLQMS